MGEAILELHMFRIEYYYREELLRSPEERRQHQVVCASLKANGRISEFAVLETNAAFPNPEAQRSLFGQLRNFASRHRVGLARVFGSNRSGFWYMPAQFIFVFNEDTLAEVFPCRIGGDDMDITEYLERLGSGQPWTVRSGGGMDGKRHRAVIAQILTNSDVLEAGLVFQGKNVQVSRDFGELGYVDLVFTDRSGRALLVEVKVGSGELDKAIGQILRHRQLFARQNGLPEESIRPGIACPYIPPQYRSICESIGVSYFEVPQSATARRL